MESRHHLNFLPADQKGLKLQTEVLLVVKPALVEDAPAYTRQADIQHAYSTTSNLMH